MAHGIELIGRNAASLLAPVMMFLAAPAGFEGRSGVAGRPLPIAGFPVQEKLLRSPVRPRSDRRRSICSGLVQPPEVQTPKPALPKGRNHHQPSKKSPSVAKPQKDIRVAEFQAALRREGFTYLKQAGRFIDQRADRTPLRFCMPVTDARRRMQRRETLAALKAWRAEHETRMAASAALQRQRIELAERLAPKAMPGCRADLTDAAAIAQLADDYLTRAAGAGSVEFKALIQMGWSAAQLREHGDAARAVADRKAVPASSTPSNL